MNRPDFDERYAQPGWAYGTEPNGFLREMAGRLPPGPVLCLGEGQGRNAVHLAALGHEATAVDRSGVGLARAQELARLRGVSIHTLQADLADFDPGEGVWSGIVAIFCHLPSALRHRVHRRLPAALVPGGCFILESYAPAQLGRGTGGPKEADFLQPLSEILEDTVPLRAELAREIEREVLEGPHHTGVGCVVQFVGRNAAAPEEQS